MHTSLERNINQDVYAEAKEEEKYVFGLNMLGEQPARASSLISNRSHNTTTNQKNITVSSSQWYHLHVCSLK